MVNERNFCQIISKVTSLVKRCFHEILMKVLHKEKKKKKLLNEKNSSIQLHLVISLQCSKSRDDNFP